MSGSVRDPPPPSQDAWEEQFFEGDIPGDIQAKLHSRDQTVYQEGQEDLSKLRAGEDHAVNRENRYGELMFVPNDLWEFAKADLKIIQDNSLDVTLVGNYWQRFFAVMDDAYRTSYRGTQYLTGRVYTDPRMLEARMSILIQYLAPYALEGNALADDWHDLYDDWSAMLQLLMEEPQPRDGMRSLAGSLRALLSFRAFGDPDLSVDTDETDYLVQNLGAPNFFGASHDGYHYPYDPSPVTILEGLKERVLNGRGQVLNDLPSEQEKADHHYSPEYQDAVTFVDPMTELIAWYDQPFALQKLWNVAVPQPGLVRDLLRLSDQEFVSAVGDGLNMKGFPDPRGMFASFGTTPIRVADGDRTLRLEPMDHDAFPELLRTDQSFYVKFFDGDDDQYYRMKSYNAWELAALLLYHIADMNYASYDSVKQAERLDRGEVLELDEYVADPLAPLIHSALTGALAQAAAVKFTGITPDMIQLIARNASNATASSGAFGKAGYQLIAQDAGSGAVYSRGLGNFIKGLAGWEWLGPNLIAAVDQWAMEQDYQIKMLYANYGEPDLLIDGTPETEVGGDHSRLPEVYDDDED
jgi:hypothetical protein